jgi:VanZ family protein
MSFSLSNNQWKRLAVGWLVFCTVLFCMPGNALPETRFIDVPFFDKWVHIGLFAILNFLFLKAYVPNGRISLVAWLLALVIYGTLIEFVQRYLIPFRSFDLVDIVADTVGALLGLLLFKVLSKYSI